MTKSAAKKLIKKAFAHLLGISNANAATLLPTALTAGKTYEAFVLAEICSNLKHKENCTLRLVNGKNISLKSSPGPINSKYPYIEVTRNGIHIGDLYTDIEFLSLSTFIRSASTTISGPLTLGEYHELDIIMVKPGQTGRPPHYGILLGVECKNTEYSKGLLKEILGVRREMCFLADSSRTSFHFWPRMHVPAEPTSCLLVYSSSSKVSKYSASGKVFGIDFIYLPM